MIQKKLNSGFTLIELMIAITVVGILASIAIASYSGYSVRAARADAQAKILELAQVATRAYTEGRTYVGAIQATVPDYDDENYDYTYTGTATTFTITVETKLAGIGEYDFFIDDKGRQKYRKHSASPKAWDADDIGTDWSDIP